MGWFQRPTNLVSPGPYGRIQSKEKVEGVVLEVDSNFLEKIEGVRNSRLNLGRARARGRCHPCPAATQRISCDQRKMKIIVKAAHHVWRTFHPCHLIISTLYDSEVLSDRIRRRAVWTLLENRNSSMVTENMLETIYPQCSEEERRLIKAAFVRCRTFKKFRSKVDLSVEPSITVGAVKSLLKSKSWIPKKNLVLVQKKGTTQLGDDSSTLEDCGVKEDEVLLACMGGSFPLSVYCLDQEPILDYVIPISSCFETVGELKKKLHQKLGISPDDQILFHQQRHLGKKDSWPLVACGISRPYMKSMLLESKRIEMVINPNAGFKF